VFLKKTKSHTSAFDKSVCIFQVDENCSHCFAEFLSTVIQTFSKTTWINLLQSVGSHGKSPLPQNMYGLSKNNFAIFMIKSRSSGVIFVAIFTVLLNYKA
jgi:hypothetical protein